MKTIDELGISPMPWSVRDEVPLDGGDDPCGKWLVDGDGNDLITALDGDGIDGITANARLIAAAPELYKALNEAVENMEEIECDPDGCAACLNNFDCVIPKFRAALAKAGGKEK